MTPGFEPGEPCTEALERHGTPYMAGLCNVLAISLHERFGLPIGCMWDAHDGPEEGKSWLVHCYVVVDEDHVIDVKGLRAFADMLDDFGLGKDDVWTQVGIDPSAARRLGGCRKGAVERAGADFAETWPHFAASAAPSP